MLLKEQEAHLREDFEKAIQILKYDDKDLVSVGSGQDGRKSEVVVVLGVGDRNMRDVLWKINELMG